MTTGKSILLRAMRKIKPPATVERARRSRAAAGSLCAAEEISQYLVTGMHHSTDEAKLKMAEIIRKHTENTERTHEV
jgi:hypothetical protein